MVKPSELFVDSLTKEIFAIVVGYIDLIIAIFPPTLMLRVFF